MAENISSSITYPVPPKLSAVGVTVVSYVEKLSRPIARREPPQAWTKIIVILEGYLTLGIDQANGVTAGNGEMLIIAGKTPLTSKHSGYLECVELSIPPWLAMPFDKSTQQNIVRNNICVSRDVFGTMDHIATARTLIDRAECAVDYAGKYMRSEIIYGWSGLQKSEGQISVRDLAKGAGYSDRQFSFNFHEKTGLKPKMTARLLRFTNAIELVADRRRGLADIAYQCGFSDQSHMSKEFAIFCQLSPSIVRACLQEHVPGLILKH